MSSCACRKPSGRINKRRRRRRGVDIRRRGVRLITLARWCGLGRSIEEDNDGYHYAGGGTEDQGVDGRGKGRRRIAGVCPRRRLPWLSVRDGVRVQNGRRRYRDRKGRSEAHHGFSERSFA